MSPARLEWFLGSALILLAAQLGFAAWHNHSGGSVGGRTFLFVGAFVEEAYPLRFVPSQIESTCPSDR